MKRMTTILVAMMAAMALGGGNSFADQKVTTGAPERLDRIFDQVDLDGSGTITVAEMRAAAAARFNALDIDGDGRVTAEERGESRDNRLGIRFRRADTDGNGALDRMEMEEVAKLRVRRRLARLDMDGDGMLSLDELREGQRRKRARIANVGVMTLPDLDARMMALFTRADANGDRVVTAEEARK